MSRMHNPAHPGEVLREYLPENVTVTQAAERLGVTREALSALLKWSCRRQRRHGVAFVASIRHQRGDVAVDTGCLRAVGSRTQTTPKDSAHCRLMLARHPFPLRSAFL